MDKNPLIIRLRHCYQLNYSDNCRLHDLCCDGRDVARNVNILHHGGPANHIRLIISGWAARYSMLPNGTRQITGLLLPGDLYNLHSAAMVQMDQGIVALTPMRIAYLVPECLKQLEHVSAEISHALNWTVLTEQATLTAWLTNMGCRPALQRVAHLLSELAERVAMSAPDNVGPRVFPITQSDLADTLGLTPVHVNRVLKELRQRAMISLRRGGLSIVNQSSLRQLGGFDGEYLHLKTVRVADQAYDGGSRSSIREMAFGHFA